MSGFFSSILETPDIFMVLYLTKHPLPGQNIWQCPPTHTHPKKKRKKTLQVCTKKYSKCWAAYDRLKIFVFMEVRHWNMYFFSCNSRHCLWCINKSNGKFEMSKKYVLMGMVSPLDPHSIIVTVKFVWCSYPVLISSW